jgi:hypothetical protein
MHNISSELSGKTVTIKADAEHFQVSDFGGSEFRVEDWWDRVYGKSWSKSDGNPAALVYCFRAGFLGLPLDDEVLYGKIGPFGHLIHISEIEGY